MLKMSSRILKQIQDVINEHQFLEDQVIAYLKAYGICARPMNSVKQVATTIHQVAAGAEVEVHKKVGKQASNGGMVLGEIGLNLLRGYIQELGAVPKNGSHRQPDVSLTKPVITAPTIRPATPAEILAALTPVSEEELRVIQIRMMYNGQAFSPLPDGTVGMAKEVKNGLQA